MKILYVASVGGFFPFFKELIRKLLDEGHIVDFAANFSESPLPNYYQEWGCKSYDLPIARNPLKNKNLNISKRIRNIVEDNKYDIVHCHTPVASICTRLGCQKLRRKGLKVFYTAHGFHFFNGAPIKNWLVFYPIEKYFSHYTDLLITINKEDYNRASEKLKAKKTVYIPGVGININKFRKEKVDIIEKRKELEVPEDAKLLISVGELSARKNHKVIIEALQILPDNFWYVVVGKGNLKDDLKSLDKTGRLKILGYRTDIADLLHASDLFVFPSLQEGLPVALMEAMASGLPCLASDIRGNNDLLDTNHLVHGQSVEEWKNKIEDSVYSAKVDYSQTINELNMDRIINMMMQLYSEFG